MVISHPQTCYPDITAETVKAALESLLYTTTPYRETALQYLRLVERELGQVPVLTQPYRRLFVLHRLLTDRITGQLTQSRQVLGLPAPDLEDTLRTAETAIAADARTGNHELLAWSWLYHRYVRTDFGFSFQHFSTLAHLDERTLRRHQRHAIERLTFLLIQAEERADREQQRQCLLARLPHHRRLYLFGRETDLTWLETHLQDTTPLPIQVVGPPGIGKTALVETVVRRQIEAGCVDKLIWVDQPISIASIQATLESAQPGYSINQYVLTPRTIVVLDGMDKLMHTVEAFGSLLHTLEPAFVLATFRQPLSLFSDTAIIRLDALNYQDTAALIRQLNRSSYPPLNVDEELITFMWQETKGNPAAVQRAFAELQLTE
jgi:hypothetical protein